MRSWSCIVDGVTEPCGNCDGCRYDATADREDAYDNYVSERYGEASLSASKEPTSG